MPAVGALAALSAPGPAREARCVADAPAVGFAATVAKAKAKAKAGAAAGPVPPDPLAVNMID